MKLEMTRCDNPDCRSLSDEMYGWLAGTLTYVGHGPTVKVEVCSEKCLPNGIEAIKRRMEYEEAEQMEMQYAALQLAILSVECPVCPAKPEEYCTTKTGNTKQEPHAGRRAAGHAVLRSQKDES